MTKEEREVMRMALKALTIFREWELGQDYNSNRDTVLVRAFKAEEAIEKCLANDALEKKAENARELGLDYESVANNWSVFNAGAEVWSELPLDEAVIELTPERLKRGWSAVCVINKNNPPVYTTPPQRKPLTDEEIILIVAECASSHQHTDIHFARAIEQAHGIYAPTELKGEA